MLFRTLRGRNPPSRSGRTRGSVSSQVVSGRRQIPSRGRVINKAATDADTEGHGFRKAAPADEATDTEGHAARWGAAPDDKTEEEDTEGHARLK